MGSLFRKEPPPREPTVYDRIGPEISHLKNKTSVRHGAVDVRRKAPWVIGITICALLWLYFMDPILYSLHKSDAIRAYLYLHNHDSANATQALIDTQIFTSDEIHTLNEKHGSYQDYFSSPHEAEQKAADIVSYMKGVKYLQIGQYESLDLVGKIRYMLFVRTGLQPPTTWSPIIPSVN